MADLFRVIGRREKISRNQITLNDLSDEECYQLTRFPRPAVQEKGDMLADDIRHPTGRGNAFSVETQVLVAVQLYSCGSFQWMIARSCDISQPSVSLKMSCDKIR